jgi:mono/diheme cytochrome c family protein
MTLLTWRIARSVRAIGPISFFLVCVLLAPKLAAAADDHAEAVAALADLNAAIGEITRADVSYSTDKATYHDAAQRAVNALVGAHDPAFSGAQAQGADSDGAIGHIDRLLDRKEMPAWAAALRGAEANIRVAAAKLRTATTARELMDYQIGVSDALLNLETAKGRPTEPGVLGGLQGALATTVLGVPVGGSVVDACRPPQTAPAYGTHGDALAFIALSAQPGDYAPDIAWGATKLTVQNGLIVLHTAAADAVAAACAAASHATSAAASAAAPAASSVPALYTKDQALAGEGVFMAKCAACHGANLHGTSAPAVAGTDFLKTAKDNGWTLEVIRYLVFTMMPLNAGGTLSPTEYADVMAFLLAANCYPAGSKPFPEADQPSFSGIQLAPVPGQHPGADPQGICPVS